jgi:hypothetical protein
MQLSQVLRHVQQLTVGGQVVVIPPAAFVRLDESSSRTVSRFKAILVFFSRFMTGSSGEPLEPVPPAPRGALARHHTKLRI